MSKMYVTGGGCKSGKRRDSLVAFRREEDQRSGLSALRPGKVLGHGSPAGLTLYHSADIGDKQGESGPFAHKGMVRKVVEATDLVCEYAETGHGEPDRGICPSAGVMTQLVRRSRPGDRA